VTDAELYGHDAVYTLRAPLVVVDRVGTSVDPLPAWCMFDPNPFPTLDLFPRARRFVRLVARLLEVGK